MKVDISNPEQKERLRNIALAGVAAGIALIDMPEGMDNVAAVGIGTALTLPKLNEALADGKWYQYITFPGGVSYDINSGNVSV